MKYNEIFEFAKELADCLCSLQVNRYSCTKEGLLSFVNEQLYGVIENADFKGDIFSQMTSGCNGDVYELSLRLGYTTLVIPVENEFWIIGPCTTETVTDDFVQSVLMKNKDLISNPILLSNQLRRLPQISSNKLRQLGLLIIKKAYPEVEPRYIFIEDQNELIEPILIDDYEQILPIRHIEERYEGTRLFTKAVSHGNFALAYRTYKTLLPDIRQLHHSSNHLRNAQNLCIIFNTTLRRAAEDGGVHPYVLHNLSEQFALQIESSSSYDALIGLTEEMLRKYCNLVADSACPKVKPLIQQAIVYVTTNLSDNLTTASVAKVLNLHPDYFAHLFSTEIGVPFIQYVNQQRISQATSLLEDTHLPIQQIAITVGFNSASYFSKQFRMIKGATPATYRKLQIDNYTKKADE